MCALKGIFSGNWTLVLIPSFFMRICLTRVYFFVKLNCYRN